MDIVSVVIPSFNRRESLRRAVASLCKQDLPASINLEIVVVDNSADGNAADVINDFVTMAAESAPAIHYLHEPKPGVATARNTGVRAARGRWVAFLDDDEEACAGWISALTEVARKSGADAVFGPVEAQSDGATQIGVLSPYFSRRIDQADGSDITALAAYLGTNNSMFDRAKCLGAAHAFDESLNESGGEDSLLLRQLVDKNCRFAWAANARVIEWAAQRRLNWAYVRKRKFLSGQIRVFVNHMAGPARWDQVVFWMAAGLAQFILAGLAALILWPLDRDRASRASATAWGGLGKLLWMPRFRPALYGAGLVS